ncbi:hypothetical protein LTR84_009662 [Exophiala bonariae]|uniref:Uncharacterized protein n=1 Tax=Exophiala bonariae TaxID=1690606 RepID=A0AAV9NK26_9EURO|nr:hypothetical protein LTR84_009662 [Exophiala bonariae]
MPGPDTYEVGFGLALASGRRHSFKDIMQSRAVEVSSSSPPASKSNSVSLIAVAGAAAAVGVVVTTLVCLAIFYCRRRRGARRSGRQIQISAPLQNPGMGRDLMSLARNTATSSTLSSPRPPFSPAPAYMSITISKEDTLEPQEIMSVGLTEEEFTRRFKSRTPVNARDGPVELAALRFSATDMYAEAEKPLFEKTKPVSRPIQMERSSRLRASPAFEDLRALAVSRSPSISPVRSDDLG